ncbi:hypothetical protein UFOVP860_38 [uncultured Caudovirales phage]|uniref:Uncharacterized protein n=1 Tax=uncultured Caudovirales phage TaxID=2100421 RepID=A0A6J5T4X9_9CAUD|nr:hypothetical protein UFOVP860_38 [uncultured Caudovirales phage]CAB4196015.1 hypothetical protein UFOVP1293_73 [uncultured Caudovirales phage]CAB4222640.1 hypothetical protein UFOVP1644_91 [uncultured Caudovirales phage]
MIGLADIVGLCRPGLATAGGEPARRVFCEFVLPPADTTSPRGVGHVGGGSRVREGRRFNLSAFARLPARAVARLLVVVSSVSVIAPFHAPFFTRWRSECPVSGLAEKFAENVH